MLRTTKWIFEVRRNGVCGDWIVFATGNEFSREIGRFKKRADAQKCADKKNATCADGIGNLAGL